MKEAQQKKDLELAEKIKLADEKLASVTKLEQDNTNLKAALGIRPNGPGPSTALAAQREERTV